MYVRQTLVFSLLSPVDLFSRNSRKGRPDPTSENTTTRRRRFVLGPPFFQHRNSRLVEERTGERVVLELGSGGIHPAGRWAAIQQAATTAGQLATTTTGEHGKKKRKIALHVQLQAGGSVESGAMRCSCRLAGWLHGKNGPERWRGAGGEKRLSGTLLAFGFSVCWWMDLRSHACLGELLHGPFRPLFFAI